jgi:hypothetical protein
LNELLGATKERRYKAYCNKYDAKYDQPNVILPLQVPERDAASRLASPLGVSIAHPALRKEKHDESRGD